MSCSVCPFKLGEHIVFSRDHGVSYRLGGLLRGTFIPFMIFPSDGIATLDRRAKGVSVKVVVCSLA
jgi:hypothetical protein